MGGARFCSISLISDSKFDLNSCILKKLYYLQQSLLKRGELRDGYKNKEAILVEREWDNIFYGFVSWKKNLIEFHKAVRD